MAGNWKLKIECLDQWMKATTGKGLFREKSEKPKTDVKFGKPNRTKFNKQR